MKFILIIIVLVFIFIVIQAVITKRRINIGIELVKKTIPFSREIQDAEIRILVIGDSTAVGVGAERPELSIAGRVAETFPEASIVNAGVSGERTRDLSARLEVLEEHYDLIMLHIGGNDIVRFTNLKELEANISQVLELATSKADHVTLTTSGSLGTAKLLPLGSRTLYEHRTRKVRAIFMQAAEKHRVPYVDLFREKKDDPFAQDPKKYYAVDIFHPSGEGYGDWYTFIVKILERIDF
ncbi:hypothetical protein IH979_01340 [Patescibacteria group bacterium]|nr:hypothetical protein [Patescibacteria group bacterium]